MEERGGFAVALVQSGFVPEDYASAEAFARKVQTLAARALSGPHPPALIAFPELTGMWLPLLEAHPASTLLGLALSHIRRRPLAAARSLLAGRGISFPFLADWRRHLEQWIEPFRRVAIRHALYVCPGSTFLPRMERNATRDWELGGRGVYNTACLINPHGRLLALTRKAYLTPEERRLGIRSGSALELEPVHTELGRIGILICLDGFHETLVSRMDGRGARILIQPSANPVPWDAVLVNGRWRPAGSGEHGLSQREQWLAQGIGSLIQGSENIRYALNPMSVSRVLGHEDEGQSSVFRNAAGTSPSQRGPYPGMVALAGSHDREEILRAEL